MQQRSQKAEPSPLELRGSRRCVDAAASAKNTVLETGTKLRKIWQSQGLEQAWHNRLP